MSSLRWGDIKISATKTMATLFNTWSTKMRTELNVQVEAKLIQTTNYLKVLKITAISDKIKSSKDFCLETSFLNLSLLFDFYLLAISVYIRKCTFNHHNHVVSVRNYLLRPNVRTDPARLSFRLKCWFPTDGTRLSQCVFA